jgi:hypothetical protein
MKREIPEPSGHKLHNALEGSTPLRRVYGNDCGQPRQANNHSAGWTRVLAWMQSFVEEGETVDARKAV